MILTPLISSQLASMDLQFYGHDADSLSGGSDNVKSPFLLHANKATTPTLKFHNHFPPDVNTWVKSRIEFPVSVTPPVLWTASEE